MNAVDFWNGEFTLRDLREDFVRVTRLLDMMKTKFEQVTDRVSYSGAGKASCLISVRAPLISVPYTIQDVTYEDVEVEEPIPSGSRSGRGKRRRIMQQRRIDEEAVAVYEPRPMASSEQFWYASEPMEELESSLGVFTLSGINTEMLERTHQIFRVRNQYNSSIRLTESWTSVIGVGKVALPSHRPVHFYKYTAVSLP